MERNQERIQESKTLNSKIKQSEWNDLYFRKKERLYSKDGIWEVPDGFSLNSPYLFKPEWSFSGISQKIFPGEGDLRSFLGKKTKETGFLEPLHKRKLDFSVLVEAGENNFQILSGLRTEINSNHNFVRATLDETILKEKFDFGMYLSGYLQSTGLKYSGPISLDCYINEDGNMEICEINFRYTMGRILYEISKKYSEFTYHTLFFEKWKNCKNIFDFKLLLDFSKSLNREDMIFLVLTPFTVTGNPTQSGVFYLGRKDSQKFIDLEKIISIEMI
ncbi:MAG: hypothetical protein H7A24_13180 [Leptospiraceae bacterium]|nr:hypothetical protein [Leptospiraceae bacterium]MCP5512830.1 hypothetical protein [Leptospiraceae bacterium]